MTAARDDGLMALPGIGADPNARDAARHRLDGAAPASSKSVLDALLDEYRVRAKSERTKGVHFEERDRDTVVMACGTSKTYTRWAVCSDMTVSLFSHNDGQSQQRRQCHQRCAPAHLQALDC